MKILTPLVLSLVLLLDVQYTILGVKSDSNLKPCGCREFEKSKDSKHEQMIAEYLKTGKKPAHYDHELEFQYDEAINSLMKIQLTTISSGTPRGHLFRRVIDDRSDSTLLHDNSEYDSSSTRRRYSLQTDFGYISVPIWIHVIAMDDGTGDIPDSMIQKQLDVLSSDYASTGIHFNLQGITHSTTNDDRIYMLGPDTALKSELRRGGKETLNVYIAGLPEAFLGWSTMPQDYRSDPLNDGVMISNCALPLMSNSDQQLLLDCPSVQHAFNGGTTLSHETGHWLGLWHSFQSGCSFPNDFVVDTAPQKDEASGCPASMDSLFCKEADFGDALDRTRFLESNQHRQYLVAGRRRTTSNVNLMDYAGNKTRMGY